MEGRYPAADRRAFRAARSPPATSPRSSTKSISSASTTTRRCTSRTRREACSAPGSARCRRARGSPPWTGRSMPDGLNETAHDVCATATAISTSTSPRTAPVSTIPLAADGRVHDADRVAYLRDHLAAARRAARRRRQAARLFRLVALDNFEWAEGYSRRFGVVRVDFATQKRTPKASYAYLVDIMRRSSSRSPQAATSLPVPNAARALVDERRVGEIGPAKARIGVPLARGRIERADRRPNLGADWAEARPHMQDPRAALGGKARVGPVGVAEAVLLDHAIFGDVLRTERGLGALGARNGSRIAAVAVRSARTAVRKQRIVMCMPPLVGGIALSIPE